MPDENDYLMMSFDQYQFTDKDQAVNDIALDMLNRLTMMFKYTGEKPGTLDTNFLERYLLYYGKAVIARADDGQLYAFFGNWGGEPGAYYYPTEFIVANPYLKFYKTLKIGIDCVLIKNDHLGLGLKRLIEKHATMLAENNLSRVLAEYNSRIQDLFVGEDDKTKAYTSNSTYNAIKISDRDKRLPQSTGEELFHKRQEYTSNVIIAEFENLYNDLLSKKLLYDSSMYLKEICDINDEANKRKFDSNLVSELEYKGLELQNLSNKLQVKVAKYNLINATNAYYYASLGDITIS